MLGADELVAEPLRLLNSQVHRRLGARRHVEHLRGDRRATGAGRLVLGHLAGTRHHGALVDAEQVEDLLDHPARQAQHADEQVLRAEDVAGTAADDALRGLDRLTGSL